MNAADDTAKRLESLRSHICDAIANHGEARVLGHPLESIRRSGAADCLATLAVLADLAHSCQTARMSQGSNDPSLLHRAFPVLRRLSKVLSFARRPVYERYCDLTPENTESFLITFQRDTGWFGGGCIPTLWSGLTICRNCDVSTRITSCVREYEELTYYLLGSRLLEATDDIDDAAFPLRLIGAAIQQAKRDVDRSYLKNTFDDSFNTTPTLTTEPETTPARTGIDLHALFPSLTRSDIDALTQDLCRAGRPSHLPPDDIGSHADAIARVLFEQNRGRIADVLPMLATIGTQEIPLLSLSVRTRNGLKRHSIRTWNDILSMTLKNLKAIRGLGKKSVTELLALAMRTSLKATGSTQVNLAKRLSDRRSTTHTAGNASNSLDSKGRHATLAVWAVHELGVRTVGDILVFAPGIELPEDIDSAWNTLSQVDVSTLCKCQDSINLGALLKTLCDLIDKKDLAVFIERQAMENPPTLQELADSLKVTRERVRQFEQRCGDRLKTLIKSPKYAPIGWRAVTVRRRLGAGVPIDSAHFNNVMKDAVSDIADVDRDLSTRILLWLAGPYRIQGDKRWLTRGCLPTEEIVGDFTDASGIVCVEGMREALRTGGVVDEVHREWMEEFGRIRIVDGIPLHWRGSIPDKAALLLSCWRRPATPEEIIEAIGEDSEARSTRQRLFGDDRFVRVDRCRIALRRWGLEEYSGLAAEIGQEIDRAGGVITIDTLVSRLVDHFDAREQSVRMYLNAPMFVIDGDNVRRRAPDEPLDVQETIPDVSGCFLVNSYRLNLRICVTSDMLRGSGSPLPKSVAVWLGVTWGKRIHLRSANGTVTVSWPETAISGPTLGSIRELLVTHQCSEGSFVLLCFSRDEMTLDLLPIHNSDLRYAVGARRIALLTGLPVTGDDGNDQRILRRALGLDSTNRSIASILRSRGDAELANLVHQEIPKELDSAIEELRGFLT